MPFVFRYAVLLRQRELAEQHAQRELGEVTQVRTLYLQRLRDMQQTISDSRRQLSDSLTGTVDVQQAARFARYALHRRSEGQRLVVQLAELEKHVDSARSRLIEATRQKRALELLQEREHEAWRKEQRRRETLELDEIADQQAARKAMAASREPLPVPAAGT